MFELKDFLGGIGPAASLIFAAWIFLSFLQQRYQAAYDYYRKLLDEYRSHDKHDRRWESLREQILEYKHRCEQMRSATHIGVISAILLIASLVCGALNIVDQDLSFLKYCTAALAIAGLVFVAIAAGFVLVENAGLQRLIDNDMSDLEDLRGHAARQKRGGLRHT